MDLVFAEIVCKFVGVKIAPIIGEPLDEAVIFGKRLSFSVQFMGGGDKGDWDSSIVLLFEKVDEASGGTSGDWSAFAFILTGGVALHW